MRIQVVVLKTCLGRWTIGRSGERGSGISVLPARYDDDDDLHNLHTGFDPFLFTMFTWLFLVVCLWSCAAFIIPSVSVFSLALFSHWLAFTISISTLFIFWVYCPCRGLCTPAFYNWRRSYGFASFFMFLLSVYFFSVKLSRLTNLLHSLQMEYFFFISKKRKWNFTIFGEHKAQRIWREGKEKERRLRKLCCPWCPS